MATAEKIVQMLEVFRRFWPRDFAAADAITYGAWQAILADIDDDLLGAAYAQYVAESAYPPKPADIRKQAMRLRQPDELTGVEAWGRVGAYIRKWPAGGRLIGDTHVDPPALPERVQRAVNAVGGLAYLRTSENTMADRARFCEVYDALSRREREHAQMLPEVRAVVERLQAGATAQLEAGG